VYISSTVHGKAFTDVNTPERLPNRTATLTLALFAWNGNGQWLSDTAVFPTLIIGKPTSLQCLFIAAFPIGQWFLVIPPYKLSTFGLQAFPASRLMECILGRNTFFVRIIQHRGCTIMCCTNSLFTSTFLTLVPSSRVFPLNLNEIEYDDKLFTM